jgi:hypothetical protein
MVDDDHADSAPVLPFQTSSRAIMLACKRMFRSTVSAKTNNADPFNCMFDARMVDDDHADSAPVLPFRASSHALMLACKHMFRATVSAKTNNAAPFN